MHAFVDFWPNIPYGPNDHAAWMIHTEQSYLSPLQALEMITSYYDRSHMKTDALNTPFPRSYWVIPGLLLAGEFPGSANRNEARSKIRSLIDGGVRQIINLMEPGEIDHSGNLFNDYEPIISQIAGERSVSVNCIRFPIADLSVPTVTTMGEILDAVADAIDHGNPIFIHCWGGVGRTGTVVGCFLMENGLANRSNVLKVIADLRKTIQKVIALLLRQKPNGNSSNPGKTRIRDL